MAAGIGWPQRPRVAGFSRSGPRGLGPGLECASEPPRAPGSTHHAASGGRRRRRPSRTARPAPRPPGSSSRGGPSPAPRRLAAAAATSPQRRALTSLRRSPADHRVEPAALQGDLVGLHAAAAATTAGSRWRGPRRGQPPRKGRAWPRPRADGGPPVARQHPGGALPGRALLAGEAGPEARRGDRRRRARRGSPLLVELGQVAGQGRVIERPAGEPGVEAAQRPGCTPSGCSG